MFDPAQRALMRMVVDVVLRVLIGGAVMMDKIDPMELARELARIASTTTDEETGRRLMEIVERILQAAGLPRGGG